MDLWIDIARDALRRASIERVDCLILNDGELRQLTGKPSLVTAAREISSGAPRVVVAKQRRVRRGAVTAEHYFALPAYPLETRRRPDRRGRHVRGRLRRLPARRTGSTARALRRAMAYGTALASYNVEDVRRRPGRPVTLPEIEARVRELHGFTQFEHDPVAGRRAR